jgi:hypothetical protein
MEILKMRALEGLVGVDLTLPEELLVVQELLDKEMQVATVPVQLLLVVAEVAQGLQVFHPAPQAVTEGLAGQIPGLAVQEL